MFRVEHDADDDDYIGLTEESNNAVRKGGTHEMRGNESDTTGCNNAGCPGSSTSATCATTNTSTTSATSVVSSSGNSACARSMLQRSTSSSYTELALARDTNVNVASSTSTDWTKSKYQDAFNRRRAGLVRLIRWVR